ncbi:peptidoglycan glycosyltransferase [Propionibacterium cyclohexanicum]|uniref:Peptidoglycan glycosyltransferase n=1 Tax=Propionibacterium cyclohexanicum TaxID=64702 RepID=A0A1H9SZR8_9ACTN|nr:penicillin-binding transpeptidase domain-containing protein [Propionibacterium cyclohexanicum]SER90356.1 peptidoglycan glycosyltransferase [Propionibacterium cyclohexanicum]
MNNAIRRVSILAAVMFFALLANVTFNYAVRSPGLLNDPANRRVTDSQFNSPRGPILVGNTAVAQSVPVQGTRFSLERRYPEGQLYAPVTGYFSYIYGRSGLERTFNQELSGSDDSQFLSRLLNGLSGKQTEGATVQTTINAKAQQAAWAALGGRTGAAIAIDYTTGAVLAWVSTPSYDPSQLSSTDLNATQQAWKALTTDPAQPMLDRATQEIYPPGSTFKLITAAAALENGMTPDTMVDSPVTLPLPDSDKSLPNAVNCGGTRITMDHALTVSCNTAFANIGMGLGADKLRAMAEKFGFDSSLGGELNPARSTFPSNLTQASLAMSSIGQYDVAASPLQMASVAGAIANNGALMEPFVVSQIRDQNLSVLESHSPTVHATPIDQKTASSLQEMMVHVVQSGTGTATQIAGDTIGGKTGTAENLPGATAYSWFTGFDKQSHVAVSVFLADPNQRGDGTVSGNATPAARTIFEALR